MSNRMTRGLRRSAAAMVMAAAVAVGGLIPEAQALTFNSGDLVFALYGNTKEYLRNLGPASTLLAPGSLNIFDILQTDLNQLSTPIAPAVDPVALRYTVFTFNADEDGNPTDIKFTSNTRLADVGTMINQVNLSSGGNGAVIMKGNGTGTPGPIHIADNTALSSYTRTFGTAGTFNTAIPWSSEGRMGDQRVFLAGQTGHLPNPAVLTEMGYAELSLDGLTLTISGDLPAPVPVPAAVVLFGTGIAGLVGVARRARARS